MEQLPSKPLCLYLRGNRYYLRKRIPTDLIGHYKQNSKSPFIIRSLGTSEERMARSKLAIALGKLEAEFEAIRKKLQKRAINSPVNPHSEALENMSPTERENIVLRWLEEQDQKSKKEEEELLASAEDEELEKILENLLAEQAYFTQEHERREFIAGQSTAKDVLYSMNIRLGKNNLELQKISRLFSLAHSELLERSIQRLQNLPVTGIKEPLFLEQRKLPAKELTFYEVCEEFKKEASQKMTAANSEKMMAEEIRILQEIIPPQTPISQIDRKACRDACESIKQIPAHAKKKYGNISIFKAIERAKKDNNPILSPKRANTYIARLQAIFKYALNEHYIDKSPAEGLAAVDNRDQTTLRSPYSPEQLNKIFISSMYIDHKNSRKNYPARFWAPLIALWSGMRLEEICQMHVSDISTLQGIDIIHVRGNAETGNRVKTRSSIRTVPIHPELVRLGFLEYIKSLKTERQERVFPELKRGSNGKYGHSISKWYRRFLTKLCIKTPKINFHSYRSTMAAALKSVNAPPEIANYLCGWKDKSMYGHYSKGENILVVYGYLKNVRYPALDLSHLYPSSN